MEKINIVYKPLKELKPYKNNPRHNEEAIEPVKQSIAEFGFKVPIILDKSNVIVAGHTRYEAAKRLGMEEVPVIYADDLDEDQVRKFRLVDNRVSEYAEWDFGKLEEELSHLDFGDFDFDFDTTGWETKEKPSVEPTFTPGGVVMSVPGQEDPYLPEGYGDQETFSEYTDRSGEFTLKSRIIITYLPEQENLIKNLLKVDKVTKVAYDITEIIC